MKKLSILLCLAVVLLSSLSLVACVKKTLPAATEQALIARASVGDHVIFGQYEQDNDVSNGKENIEWIVLDKTSDKALLISRYCLDNKAHYANGTYNGKLELWSGSLIRSWLNSQFINQAFSPEEKAFITNTSINDIDTGNVSDKIFLLSSTQVSSLFLSANERITSATPFAKAQGADGNWWTRSKPSYGTDVALLLRFVYVSYEGQMSTDGNNCVGGFTALGIRPALWISIR